MAKYVEIINCTLGGRYFHEGRARLLARIDDDHAFVDFEDGFGPVERFVDQEAQKAVSLGRYIADLNAKE